jgi:hypothetical protein
MPSNFNPSTVEEFILEGAARALWVSCYADAADRGDLPDSAPTAGAGEDWCDIAPVTPIRAYLRASVFLAEVLTVARSEAAGRTVYPRHIQCLWQVFGAARHTDDYDKLISDSGVAETFGHLLAMQSMGHGVSWGDDHESLPFRVPRTLEGFDYSELK